MDAMGKLVLARGETNAYRNAYHALPPHRKLAAPRLPRRRQGHWAGAAMAAVTVLAKQPVSGLTRLHPRCHRHELAGSVETAGTPKPRAPGAPGLTQPLV